MNHQLPKPIRAPTPFSTPRKSDSSRPRSPLPAELILHHVGRERPADPTSPVTGLIDALTPRRLEVLKLVARGLTNPEIASVLGISANTIKAHLAGIFETLDLTNRTEAAVALQDYEVENRILSR
jgi:DNA-binding NarL/FixJ family response regulator